MESKLNAWVVSVVDWENKDLSVIAVEKTEEAAMRRKEQELFEILFEENENEDLHEEFRKKFSPHVLKMKNIPVENWVLRRSDWLEKKVKDLYDIQVELDYLKTNLY